MIDTHKVIRSLQWLLVILVMLIGGVWWVGYDGRLELRNALLQGCERGKLDRAANARAWREAQKARLADGDYTVAMVYSGVAASLERRAAINCAAAFPAPSLIPLP